MAASVASGRCARLHCREEPVASGYREKWQNIRRNFGDSLTPYVPAYFPVAWKMALVFSAIIVFGLALLGSITLNSQLQRMQAQADRYGAVIATQLAGTAREPLLAGDTFTLEVLVNQLARGTSLEGAALFNRDGEVLHTAGPLPDGVIPAEAASRTQWRNDSQPMTTYFTTIDVDGLNAGYAAVTLSRAPILAAKKDAQETMVSATLIMALLAMVVAFVISRRLSRPIHDLVAATRALGGGDLHYRIKDRRNDEIGKLIEAYNEMALGLLQKDQVERVLSRFVSPSVASQMMADLDQVSLGGRQVNATVVFADIVGFTELSERITPDEVAEMLNGYFDAITVAATFYRGTIDKYMGDCAMIVFGVPENDTEHAFHGLCCAVMIQRLIQRLNGLRESQGLTTVQFRIGINSGEMLAGNLGSRDRMQYTVVGDSVNLASRLSNMAGPGEVTAPASLVEHANIRPRVKARETGTIRVRGKQEPISTFLVEGLHSQSEVLMEQRIAQFLNQLMDTHDSF